MRLLHELLHGLPVEPPALLPSSDLINDDIAPTALAARSWSLWHIAALWVGMSVCIPTYMLASSMIQAGMSWRMALVTIILGNLIVLVPLALNGHAGTKYGIPFPAFARAAFGVRGAHVPSLLRAVVACGWFGIQTWIGGSAIDAILDILWSGWSRLGGDFRFMGYGLPEYLAFLLFWAINMAFVYAGTESIKWLEALAAPFLILVGVGLLGWAAYRVGGVGEILARSDALAEPAAERAPAAWFFGLFLPWLTAMVGYWATLSLNIPDFTRFARSQRDQIAGQALGLMTAMPLFAFIGVAVTSATVVLYGEAIWNPVDLLARIAAESGSAWLGVLVMLVLALATLSTNIAANVVAPANSISALAPRRIDFRTGGLIAGTLGILILPWRLLDMYQGWLISYSGLLGAVGGVLVCDYLLVRGTRLNVVDLYRHDGEYAYDRGVHWPAMVALGAGIAVALAGRVVPGLSYLFEGAWFSAAATSFVVYRILAARSGVVADAPDRRST